MGALTIPEVLEQAADILAKPGAWTQGVAYRDASGRQSHEGRHSCMCVLGALWLVDVHEMSDTGPATTFLESFLGEWPGVWNDKQDRTQDEVVASLRAAAVAARGDA